jgi:hypothetical protein
MLRHYLLLVAVIAVSSTYGTAQSGNCAAGLADLPFDCYVEGGCHASGDRYFPVGSEYYNGTYVECVPVSCCGEPQGVTCTLQGYCGNAELNNPAIRGKLLKVARDEALLVSDCTGKFVPLEAMIETDNTPLRISIKPKPWRDSL